MKKSSGKGIRNDRQYSMFNNGAKTPSQSAKASGYVPLHQRTHWRRLKECIRGICNYEAIDYTRYDLEHITCYSIKGSNLSSSAFTYHTYNGYSPFYSPDLYEVYEAPLNSETKMKYPFVGTFLFIARNVPANYWIFGILTVNIDIEKTKKFKQLFEYGEFKPYGTYIINTTPHSASIKKNEHGYDVTYGGTPLEHPFDPLSVRLQTYDVSKDETKLVNMICGIKGSKIIDPTPVKRYKINQGQKVRFQYQKKW